MSLAAEQARLLTITARKSDCEFQSMNLSHQKIALSRDMENVSTTYQNALNTTKLVFDYYGSQTSQMDLTYGLLMTPSIYNDYYPKLVTDAKNRVVLNSAYAAAARAAGIPAEGLSGTPSSDIRNKFIEALAGQNIITPNKAATIQGITYGNTIGIGTTSNSTSATTEITYDELIDLITAKCEDSASWGMTMGTTADRAKLPAGSGSYEKFCVNSGNGTEQGATSQSVTLADLLNDKAQYYLSLSSPQGEKTPIYETAYLQEKIVGESENSPSFLNWITDQFGTILGGTSASDAALQAAYNAVYDLIYPDSNIQDAAEEINNRWGTNNKKLCDNTEKHDRLNFDGGAKTLAEHMNTVGTKLGHEVDGKHDSYNADVVKESSQYLGFTYTSGHNGGRLFHPDRNDHTTVGINLNNIVDVFLTAYVGAMKGPENNDYTTNVGKKSESNMYDPKNDDFKFTIPVDTDAEDESDTCLEASFYDTMFNRICLDGWTENNRIDDASYMQEMLKTGMVYISSISDDGYYYQGNYATDKNISEVPDEEAIAKAEAKYNTEKNKIENKEQKIDMKMKSLDTEIASLTTEYDTTKSVISKNIEKSFKRYDA